MQVALRKYITDLMKRIGTDWSPLPEAKLKKMLMCWISTLIMSVEMVNEICANW